MGSAAAGAVRPTGALQRGDGLSGGGVFALDAGAWGNPSADESAVQPCLGGLQMRPQSMQLIESAVDTEAVPEDRVLCRTHRSLGQGTIEDVNARIAGGEPLE